MAEFLTSGVRKMCIRDRVESDKFWRWGDDNLFPTALALMSRRSTTQDVYKRQEQVLTDDAGYEDISIRDERTTTLASAFEPAAVIEALAEIAASPQVWKIDGDKYEEVDILTREQTRWV